MLIFNLGPVEEVVGEWGHGGGVLRCRDDNRVIFGLFEKTNDFIEDFNEGRVAQKQGVNMWTCPKTWYILVQLRKF